MKFFTSLLSCAFLFCQLHADLPPCANGLTTHYEQACRATGKKCNATAISAARSEAQKFLSAKNFVAAKKLTDYADNLEKNAGSPEPAGSSDKNVISCAGSFLDGKQWKIRSGDKDYLVTATGEDWGWKEYKSKFVRGGGRDVLLLDSNWAIVWVSPTRAAHFHLEPEGYVGGMVMSASKGGKSKQDSAQPNDKSADKIIENIEYKRIIAIKKECAEHRKTYFSSLRALMLDCGQSKRLDDAAAIQQFLEDNAQATSAADKKPAKDSGGFPKGTFSEHPGSFDFEFKGKSMLCKDRNNGHEMKAKHIRTSPNNEVFVFHRQADNMDIALFWAKGQLYLIYTHESLEQRGIEGLRILKKH